MSEVINGSLDDVLGAIGKVQDKNVYPVFIPSLDTNVMFKEMTTSQEKMIIKTIVDNPIYNSEFIFAIREIIKQNCAEKIDIDTLTIIDKTMICLTMRMKSIGNEFEYVFKNTDKTKTIKISEYIEKFEKIKIPEDKVVGSGDIKVTCSYPTVLNEYKLEKEFRFDVESIDANNLSKIRNVIGEVFTNEIVKYIKGVSITNDDQVMELNMDDYDFKSRITILEKIGNSVTQDILKYIEEVNKDMRQALKVELELDEKDQKKYNSEKLSSLLETGSDFFIIS